MNKNKCNAVKMRKTVCRICLRSDFQRTDVIDEELFDFFDELCDFDVLPNDNLKFCMLCEHLLRKFYKFQLRCKEAHKILKTHRKKGIENLQDLLPPSHIGFASLSGNQKFIDVPPRDVVFVSQENDELMEKDIKKEVIDDPISMVEDVKLDLGHDIIKQENVPVEFPISYTQNNTTNTQQNDLEKTDEMILQSDDKILRNEEIRNDEIITKKEIMIDVPFDDADNFDCFDEDTRIVKKKVTKKALKVEKIVQPKQARKQKVDDEIEIDDIVSVGDLEYVGNTTQKQKLILHKHIKKLKEKVMHILERGTLDLGDEIKMTKETFVDMLNKCDLSILRRTLQGMLKNDSRGLQKIKNFLQFLWKYFDPKYEKVFRIEYMTTHAQKVAEFEARSKSEEYLKAEFKCDICYKVFEVPLLLDYHKRMHDESREHACEICSMRFESRANLSAHRRNSHNYVYRCKHCDLTIYSFIVMRNHYDGHMGKTYTCNICQTQYNSLSCYNSHRQSHGTQDCPHCYKKFFSAYGLDKHVKTKHPGTVAESSSTQIYRNKHVAQYRARKRSLQKYKENTKRIFKCETEGCSAQFPSAAARRRHAAGSGHVVRPRRRRPYKTCRICGEQIANMEHLSLYLHYKEMHPDVPYVQDKCKHLCEHCGKAFRHFNHDHVNIHTGAKPYDCAECGEQFHTGQARDTHRLRHFPPSFECEFCGKKLRSSGSLFTHTRTHIGDRRFKCKICSKGFLHPGALKEHIRGVHNHIRRVKTTRNTEASDSKATLNTDASDSKTTRNTETSDYKTTRNTETSDSKTTRNTETSDSKTTCNTEASDYKTTCKTESYDSDF